MKNCKNCVFCKKDALSDYIKEADFFKCDMDGDMILDPYKEGMNCAWYKGKFKSKDTIIKKLKRWVRRQRR